MKTLLEKLQELEHLEEITSRIEEDYDREPENVEFEKAFDAAYKEEFNAYISAAQYIEHITSGRIDFLTAKAMIQTKREELKQLLAI